MIAGLAIEGEQHVTATDNANYRDFTRKRERVYFNINGEEFDCRKALSPRNLQLAMNAFRNIKREFSSAVEGGIDEDNAPQLIDKISDTLIHFMKRESFERLNLLIKDDDAEEPVDVMQLMEILEWVLGRMAGRPTEPSPVSTTTSPSDGSGTSSTAGAQLEASTPSS